MKKCPYCKNINLIKKGFLQGKQKWRCKDCKRGYSEGSKIRKAPQPRPKTTGICLHCGKATMNPKFCSLHCAATYNNLNHRERYEKTRKQRFCKHCGVEVVGRRTTCDECNMHNINWEKRPLSEIANKASYQIHAHIRQRARYLYRKSNRPKYCVNCGYDKHIEICHIHAIADFSEDTIVAKINDLKNLVALCLNCHWELDKGSLSIEEIRGKNDAID